MSSTHFLVELILYSLLEESHHDFLKGEDVFLIHFLCRKKLPVCKGNLRKITDTN